MADTKYNSPTQRRTSMKRYSPRKDDSPSRQLGFELEKALEQLQLHDFERRKVHAYNRRSYHEELDAKDMAMAKAHMEALDAASARHEAVRHEAEAVLRRHMREQEEKRQREEAEERLRQEREAREKAERERRAREEAERMIRIERERRDTEARKAAEEKAKAEAAEVERKEREAALQKQKEAKAQAEKERLEREVNARAQAERDAAERQKVQLAVASARPSAPTPSQPGFYSASPEAEARHKEFLALHQKLKTFRKDFWEQAKQNKQFKAAIGEMRRSMRTSVGQLTDDKVGNKQSTERVKKAIIQALKEIPSPEISISEYFPPHLSLNDQGSTKIPSLVIYLISILSKAIINAFVGECAVNPRAAEPIGTLTAQVFSLTELQFPRQSPSDASQSSTSLIPILLAKYHKVAPILFGISGPESTPHGRLRLGWRTEGEGNDKTFVPEQRHHERMTGLGAGFSSIALRNFSKTRLRNPFPPTHFWFAIAAVVDTPPSLVQTSHLLLLKSMLENNAAERFVLFYGNVAVAVLREALVEFPKRLPEALRSKPACRSLQLMVDALEKEKHFRLT